MKKILLFADVGGHEEDRYYHVGDEAMLYETYRWYKQFHSNWELSILSWFQTHPQLEAFEAPHLHWSKTKSYTYFPLLCIKLLLFRVSGVSLFSSQELALVRLIAKQDRIHFTGGGNLSTQFRQWLYYSFFVILTAKAFGKEVILTSQTIGPIRGVDRVFAFFFLNLPELIAIRAKTHTSIEFKRYGAFLPKIRGMLDAAYTLPSSGPALKTPARTRLKIGLSLHAWAGWEKQGQELVKQFLLTLAKKYALTIVLVPHHLVPNEKGTDIAYMKRITDTLPRRVEVFVPDLSKMNKQKNVSATYIKKLSGLVDILLTTRYHGIIFGLSQNVPTMALQFDEYYKIKNSGALEIFYGSSQTDYQVDVKNASAPQQLLKKTLRILDNLKNEKSSLKMTNSRLITGTDTLHSVMSEFETVNKAL